MSLNKHLTTAALALVAALAVPAVASADATISRSGSGPYQIDVSANAAPLDIVTINDIETYNPGGGSSGVRFTGVGLSGGTGCTASGGNTVVQCTSPSSATAVRVFLGAGTRSLIQADPTFSTPLNVQPGYSGSTRVVGGSAPDVINGGSGEDDIEGGAGDDTVYGNDGNDHIAGNAGTDNLFGGNGDDALGAENAHDADRLDCGAGDDVMGLDLNAAGQSEELSMVNCEYNLPHTQLPGSGQITLDPVQGQTFWAAYSSTPRFSVSETAPDAFLYRWYLCTTAAAPLTSSTFEPANFEAPAGPTPRAGCSLIAGNTAPSASVSVPAGSTGQFLTAVGKSGFSTTAGWIEDRGGMMFATESFATFTGRQIQATGSVPPPPQPIRTTTLRPTGGTAGAQGSTGLSGGAVPFTATDKAACKKGKCTIRVTQSAAGKVTIKGSKVKPVSKTVRAGTTAIAVKLSSKAAKTFRKKGKLKTSVKVTSTGNAGGAKSATVKLTYKR